MLPTRSEKVQKYRKLEFEYMDLCVGQNISPMKEVFLVGEGGLVDSDGIRYKRENPVLTLNVKMTSRGSHIHPTYFEQQILDLQKEGKLEKGLFAVNAYAVVGRRDIDEKETIMRSWGPTDYHYSEVCEVELYFLGE